MTILNFKVVPIGSQQEINHFFLASMFDIRNNTQVIIMRYFHMFNKSAIDFSSVSLSPSTPCIQEDKNNSNHLMHFSVLVTASSINANSDFLDNVYDYCKF